MGYVLSGKKFTVLGRVARQWFQFDELTDGDTACALPVADRIPMIAETMASQKEHSNRLLPVKLGVLFLSVFLVGLAVAPTKGRVVGYYISPSDSGLVVMQVNEDGSYIQYDQRQVITRGHWRLENKFFVFKSLVFENSYHLPVSDEDLKGGKRENWYSLYTRAGELCMRVGPDPEYWCKHKSMEDVEK